ncbi:hypothetical protein EI94DRAFT_1830627 [Lactarius quietus]|nr:hypothetical protein EI94DRAFT_1830627 [Lactarius quietus]
MRAARILGYLIIYSPTITAQQSVVNVIHSCGNDYPSLSALGLAFFDHYIRPFKKYKGRTPEPSSHSSHASFEQTEEQMLDSIKEVPRDHSEAKKRALRRDGYRCLVTGKYDLRVDLAPDVIIDDEQARVYGGAYTECAHIVPEPTYFNVTKSSDKNDYYSASVLAVLKQFGYHSDNPNGEKVHSLFNVMTMQHDVHDFFDRLMLWFEKTDTPNCYNVRTTLSPRFFEPRQVTFTTPHPVKLPLPSPELLALHATCAQVAHLSGASEYIDRILEDMEETRVLAHDGTSSEVLHYALTTLSS